MARRWYSAKVLLGSVVAISLALAAVVLGFSAATPAASRPSTQGVLVLTTSSGQQITLNMSSYSFGVQRSLPGGEGPSTLNFSPFSIVATIGANTPLLLEAETGGTLFPSATLAVPTAGGGVETISFGTISPRSVVWRGGKSGIGTESVSFNYVAVQLSYQSKAGATPSSSFGWNGATNSPSNISPAAS
jgi:type VI protein secretion system component Hcp